MEARAEINRQEFHTLLRQMMWFRLIVATSFLLVSFFVLEDRSFSLYALVGAFYLLTIIYPLIAKSCSTSVSLPYLQIMVDVVIVTLVIATAKSGGGLFLFLYLVPIISASLYFEMKHSAIVALGCGLMYCLIILYKTYDSSSSDSVERAALLYHMFLNLIVFYVVGFLCGYLVKQVRAKGQELSKLQNLHNLILQSMNSGLVSVNNQGRIVFSNLSAQRTLGYSSSELKGMDFLKLFVLVEDGVKKPINILEPAQQKNYRTRAESICITKTAKEVPLGHNISLIYDEHGNSIGRILVFTDLTNVKKLEEKLRQGDKLKAIGELAAGIAHEIRNPLAAISGSIEMLAESSYADDGNKRLFGVVLRESSRLNGIIEGFLNYTRRRDPELQRVNTYEMLEDIIMLMEHDPAIHKGIQISIDRQQKETDIVGDAAQLRQVFINLIKNAADAMPNGGSIHILLTGAEEAQSVEVLVTDTGCGIARDQLKDIFNPFFTTKSGGMGIGLSVAEKITRNHGGQISVDSVLDEGTVFTISLPAWIEKTEFAGV